MVLIFKCSVKDIFSVDFFLPKITVIESLYLISVQNKDAGANRGKETHCHCHCTSVLAM
jgi:hypothetical protein